MTRTLWDRQASNPNREREYDPAALDRAIAEQSAAWSIEDGPPPIAPPPCASCACLGCACACHEPTERERRYWTALLIAVGTVVAACTVWALAELALLAWGW